MKRAADERANFKRDYTQCVWFPPCGSFRIKAEYERVEVGHLAGEDIKQLDADELRGLISGLYKAYEIKVEIYLRFDGEIRLGWERSETFFTGLNWCDKEFRDLMNECAMGMEEELIRQALDRCKELARVCNRVLESNESKLNEAR